MRLATAIAGATCALAVCAAPAPAATVARSGDTLVYSASPGTSVDLGVQTGADASSIVLYTVGDDMTTWPSSCSPSSIRGGAVVECADVSAVRADLGDGDDIGQISDGVIAAVTISGGAGADILEGNDIANTLDGGPGDDKLSGADGADVLLGSDGADDLQGKGGADRLDGGGGNDALHPDGFEAPNADVVDGGTGVDTVDSDYSSRFSSDQPLLAITLAGGADDGRPGEGDDLRNVERVELGIGGRFTGSAGADTIKLRQVGSASELTGLGGDDALRGGDGADRLDGGAGADALDGGFGDDVITGGPGRDTISADLAGGDCGPAWCKYPYGNDTVYARDGEVDSITCGAGRDRVVADTGDVIAADCEDVERAGATSPGTTPPAGASHPGAATGARMTIKVPGRLRQTLRDGLVVRVSGMRSGALTVQARLGRKLVAVGRVNVGPGGTATARVRFSRTARRTLIRRKSVRLTIKAASLSRAITVKR